MALRVLLIDSDAGRAASLTLALNQAGFDDVLGADAGADLVETVRRLSPDLVVIDMALPDRDALEGVRSLSANVPRPIVMFADKDDPAFVDEAIAAGVCSYNLSGVSDREMKSIVASAVALFRRYNKIETELAEAKSALEERRVIERAKATLMAKRKITEPAAYRWLQRTAMNENRRIAQVAADVIKGEDDNVLLA